MEEKYFVKNKTCDIANKRGGNVEIYKAPNRLIQLVPGITEISKVEHDEMLKSKIVILKIEKGILEFFTKKEDTVSETITDEIILDCYDKKVLEKWLSEKLLNKKKNLIKEQLKKITSNKGKNKKDNIRNYGNG